ncbi:arsenate reductase (glutaredoxin) [Candidatus Methylospira mobilis]|uniref:Arsenate reductase n=1 Tax=Candidatus Methylospira mobilis TaxID=1808979 RepID=A0A5Q0BHZ4_9GAMM|nr:arsenate reductase (glutaredoxin) [Candidatus Methylospira mobilis]QFY43450.1 arsenate reductase (glutaredoxin) [Candidatus Methylospira mobilis]WNV03312.1 arsenate reductase (glutaredoxin) [Candidatus Methylospira mobilis]
MSVTIYHNPRCSKSRAALQLLKENGIECEVVEYLKSPPSAERLDAIIRLLGMEPRALMRKNEAPYKTENLADQSLSREQLIAAMIKNPVLIERPIVFTETGATLGRPPENVLQTPGLHD